MNKFFKRILPATILTTCCTVSVFSMTACNEGKDYSEDIAKLQQQIEDLQTENNSLKDKVNNLTPGGVDYTEEIEKLQQQIEALKVQNASYLEESTKLKQQIETLKTNNESNLSEISKLETQLASLKTSNDSNLSEIKKLEQQIDTLKAQNTQLTEQASNQQKLIESLQSATSTQPKIYKVGDTFTYSYQGVEFFSITVTIDEFDWWQLTVQNFRMGNRKASEYIGCLFMSNAGSVSNGAITDTSITPNDEYTFAISAKTDFHIKLLLGFPLQNNNLVPYAIYDLTSSV